MVDITEIFTNLDRKFRIGVEPFSIDQKTYSRLVKLGQILLQFYHAVNELYDLSLRGHYPSWIHEYLDAGKTERVIDYGRMRRFKNDLPFIIRPDVILTDEGFIISELDSVPGGFGMLAELSQYYAEAGFNLIGGRDGIITNFAKAIKQLSGQADPVLAIVVSAESQDYFGEMKWMADALTAFGLTAYAVAPEEISFAETGLYLERSNGRQKIDVIYRFFELFDLKNIPKMDLLLYAVRKQTVVITPPLKSYLEEKLLFALLHHPVLAEFWTAKLGESGYHTLLEVMPPTWIMDNRPLPPHAVIPNLQIGRVPVTDWQQLKQATKRQREMVIKISGFSELSWGSQGVCIGHDVSSKVWSDTIDHALDSFPHNPYILQKFYKGKRVSASYYDLDSKAPKLIEGRARLCPYYMVHQDHVQLAGVLATICPLDKKLIHGMVDAVMVPTMVKWE
ncbi:MAG: hypothetical protein GX177_05505 [Firmicutes bacterium]|jgi:hypothetical protein|nr:hypothetical protein [Bacillota bacterium]